MTATDAVRPGVDVKVGDLASDGVVSVTPTTTLRKAAQSMVDRGIGSVVVLDDAGNLAGILTERDLLRALADADLDVDTVPVSAYMTADVVTITAAWEVYEAAAEMADKHIRHLVVVDDNEVTGILSIRDLLLAGQRIELRARDWAVLRDPLTFTIRERRRLQKQLIDLDVTGGEPDVDDLIALMVASWSLDLPLPADREVLDQTTPDTLARLRAAVMEELPGLQRAVHPAPGWRRWGD